jgi:hypothetical protein
VNANDGFTDDLRAAPLSLQDQKAHALCGAILVARAFEIRLNSLRMLRIELRNIWSRPL